MVGIRDYILTGYYIEVYFEKKHVRYIAVNDGIDTNRDDNDIAPLGFEEMGMIQCHTLNRSNPVNNQIHGVSPINGDGEEYMNAAWDYLFNHAEDWVLNIFE